MTDLFRGYDLTTVLETVAERRWNALVAQSDLTDEGKAQRSWDKLPATAKRNFKQDLLPIVTDVLEALESDQVKPTEAKQMVEYGYTQSRTPSRGDLGRGDPRFYENQEHQHDTEAATVWALHLNVRPEYKDAVLERMSVMPEVTGEYTYDGDSFREWGTPAEEHVKYAGGDPINDQHMVIYFDATPKRAREVGDHLADHATMAADAAARAMTHGIAGDPSLVSAERHVSTSGDYAEQV